MITKHRAKLALYMTMGCLLLVLIDKSKSMLDFNKIIDKKEEVKKSVLSDKTLSERMKARFQKRQFERKMREGRKPKIPEHKGKWLSTEKRHVLNYG